MQTRWQAGVQQRVQGQRARTLFSAQRRRLVVARCSGEIVGVDSVSLDENSLDRGAGLHSTAQTAAGHQVSARVRGSRRAGGRQQAAAPGLTAGSLPCRLPLCTPVSQASWSGSRGHACACLRWRAGSSVQQSSTSCITLHIRGVHGQPGTAEVGESGMPGQLCRPEAAASC